MGDDKPNQRKRSILYLRVQDDIDRKKQERTDDYKELGKTIDKLNYKIDDLHHQFEELFAEIKGLYEQRDELLLKLQSREGDEFQIWDEVAIVDNRIGTLELQLGSCEKEIESSIRQIDIGIETETVIDHFRNTDEDTARPAKKRKVGLV